jgi:hypothetical protein
MIKVFCDLCKNEITGENVGRGGWRVESGSFVARVTVYKDSNEDGGDLCLDCLLKMLNQKPKRKYDKKKKPVDLSIDFPIEIPKFSTVSKKGPELREMEDGLNSEGLTLLRTAGKILGNAMVRRTDPLKTPVFPPEVIPPEPLSQFSITQVVESREPVIANIKKRTRKARKATGSPLDKPDISTFSVTIGQDDKPHQLKMGEVAVASVTLKEGALCLLKAYHIDQAYVEDAEDSEGKRNLLDILNAK